MSIRFPVVVLVVAAVLGLSGLAMSQQAAESKKDEAAAKPAEKAKPSVPRTEEATFAGGCFWCMEAIFERLKGVKSVVSGYAGGSVENPSYEMVCTGLTGHAEAIQITYDPDIVSYEDLLEIFWVAHDPTTLNRQGPDEGTQYRSAIFFHNEAQREAAVKSYKHATAAKYYRNPIVTQLLPLTKFYAADEHHQDYYRKFQKNPTDPTMNAYYCGAVIGPHLREVQAKVARKAAAREKAEKDAKAAEEKKAAAEAAKVQAPNPK